MTEELKLDNTNEEKTKHTDYMLSYAYRISLGEAGASFVYCIEEDRFYIYKDGYWQWIKKEIFLFIILKAFPKTALWNVAMRRQILENYKIIKNIVLDDLNKTELMNFTNYMFDPITAQKFPHSEEHMSTSRIPYEYNPDATCDLWLKTLDEILEKDQDKIILLQEFFGYCLTKETKHHKALLLLGESRSGKSTILHVLHKLIGEKNCSAVPLKDVGNPQQTPGLINKLVNIDYDVSQKAVEFEDEFKKITGGEPIRVNQKYIEAFDFIPYCKLAMSANIFPRITDHSSAFYNRLILIPCDRVFSPEEQNKDLPKQLEKELSGILNWAVEGLKRLNNNNRFTECIFMKEAVKELEDENNPVNLFFREHVEINMEGYITKGELYDKYKQWSERTKNYALSENRFSNCVFKTFHRHTIKNARENNNGKRIWKNITYVDSKNNSKGQLISWQD